MRYVGSGASTPPPFQHFGQRVFWNRHSQRRYRLQTAPGSRDQCFLFADEVAIEIRLGEDTGAFKRLEPVVNDILGDCRIATDVAFALSRQFKRRHVTHDVTQVQIRIDNCFDIAETKQLLGSLAKRSWDFETDVNPINRFALESLDEGQSGWDWAAIQLKDGREVMVYRMRRTDGTTDAASSLTWIAKDGALKKADFSWKALAMWKSPHSGAEYPNHVRIESEGSVFELRPLVQDQEQGGSITGLPYWEGACDVLDERGEVIGRAFLELAGYAGDLRKYLGGK